VTRAQPRYSHLFALTDEIGLFEHALFTLPRPEHGYCVDDVARGLVILCRGEASETGPVAATSGHPSGAAADVETGHERGRRAQIAWTYLDFVLKAQAPDGRIVNRCDCDGHWHGEPGVDDCWGRALWGLGTAASRSRDPELARRAIDAFRVSAALRSPSLRAMAYAGLGAAEVLRVDNQDAWARALLTDVAQALVETSPGPVGTSDGYPGWPWPQPRLTYANALIPDVLLAAGDCLGDPVLRERGLSLLRWLVDLETASSHLSVTPSVGWAPGDPRPGFDQQPIEVSTLADACARAFEMTGEPCWSDTVELAAAWFFGVNDTGITLADDVTGGCCDGLQKVGRNENQGAESTLALLSTLQHARRLLPLR
jgi:hypothetical protein